MTFGLWTRVGPRNHALHLGPDPLRSRRNFRGTCCHSRSPCPSPSLVSSGYSQFPLPRPSLRPPSQSIPCLGLSTPRVSKYVPPNSSSYHTHILTAPSSLPPSQSHFPVGVHQPAPPVPTAVVPLQTPARASPPQLLFSYSLLPDFSPPCPASAFAPHVPHQTTSLSNPSLSSPVQRGLSVGHNREPCKNGYTVEIPCGL